jgi:hypothetical protein
VIYKFDGFHGRALYELNGLPEQVRSGPLLQRLLELLESPWDPNGYCGVDGTGVVCPVGVARAE